MAKTALPISTGTAAMYLLAPASYVQYKQALVRDPQPYSQWLIDAVDTDLLRGRELQSTIRTFFFFLRGR